MLKCESLTIPVSEESQATDNYVHCFHTGIFPLHDTFAPNWLKLGAVFTVYLRATESHKHLFRASQCRSAILM